MKFSIEASVHLPKVFWFEVPGEWLRTEDLVSMDRAMRNRKIRTSYWLPWLHESLRTRGVLLARAVSAAYLSWLQDRQLRVRILDTDATALKTYYRYEALRSLKLIELIKADSVCDLQLDPEHAPYVRHVVGPLCIVQELFEATGISACNIDSLNLHIGGEDEKLEDCEAWLCLFDEGSLTSLNVNSDYDIDLMRIDWFRGILQCWCLNLRFLSINSGIIEGDWIKLLDPCKKVVSLDCGRCKIHLHDLLQRPWATSLTSVERCFSQPHQNSQCLIIPEMACLSTLCLGNYYDDNDKLRDADVMQLLSSCKGSLTSIDLRGCSELTEATALLAVENSAGILTKLVWEEHRVRNKVVCQLADCSAACIQHLDLASFTGALSDASIIHFAECVRAAPGGGALTHIKLSSDKLSDASVGRLADCCGATLTTGLLYSGFFSDESILRITVCCVKIRSLAMRSSPLITDRSVVRFAELRGSRLSNLRLYGKGQLTDASLDALARYCGVPGSEQTHLELQSSHFSDVAKERLRQLEPAIKCYFL